MADTSIDILLARQAKSLDPLLGFKWACVYMPGLKADYVESVNLPFPEISAKDGLFGAGTYTYYPGFEDINAFDITFYEDSQLTTTKWLHEWFLKIRRPKDGAYYLPGNYKKTMALELMDTTGRTLATVEMQHIWPTGKSDWDLNYTNDDRLVIQQNFSCDSQEIKIII